MKAKLILRAIGQTLAALFFSLLELLYQAGRGLVKWSIVAVVVAIKAAFFVVLSPYWLVECGARALRHWSFAAGGQLAKWIWIDYWKTTRI